MAKYRYEETVREYDCPPCPPTRCTCAKCRKSDDPGCGAAIAFVLGALVIIPLFLIAWPAAIFVLFAIALAAGLSSDMK